MAFDLDRCLTVDGGRCRTRDGREARVICTDRKDYSMPLVALIDGEYEGVFVFHKDGSMCSDCETPSDLVNLPRKLKVWVVMWRGEDGKERSVSFPGADGEADAKRYANVVRSWGAEPVVIPVEADEPA